MYSLRSQHSYPVDKAVIMAFAILRLSTIWLWKLAGIDLSDPNMSLELQQLGPYDTGAECQGWSAASDSTARLHDITPYKTHRSFQWPCHCFLI